MKEWISQLAPLARGEGLGEWANILFLVVIAVFSVVGGLIKNVAAKGKQQAGRGASQGPAAGPSRETWQQRLGRKAEEIQRAIEAKYGQTQQQPPAPSPSEQNQPGQGKLTIRTDRGGESIMVLEKDGAGLIARQQAAKERQAREATASARRRAAERRLGTKSKPQSNVAGEAIGRQGLLSVGATAEPPREPASSYAAASIIIDSNDPEALKKAILHYEILGKPLAWRDPLEHTSGF